MPHNVSKDCFPTPSKCHNCQRKMSSHVKKEMDPKENYKRCSSCHLLTYCDKDCQREHWMKVHKNHCRFLSGKTPVKKHNATVCAQCIDQKQASPTQLKSENSPKTICNIEEVVIAMKKALNEAFGFHGDGKKCNCSMEYGFDLPFSLGEVSGQYIEMGNTGLDAMMAHSLKILMAMFIKSKNEGQKIALGQLWNDLIGVRSQLWSEILVRGMPIIETKLMDQVDNLQKIYGVSNPWWKTLYFSVQFIVKTNKNLLASFYDSGSLEDPRFQNLKQVTDYCVSQLHNQEVVCSKKFWPNWMFWPEVVSGKLALLLPPRSRCESCYDELSGEVTVSSDELNFQTLTFLFPDVGGNGALKICCPLAKNPSCTRNSLSKNVPTQMGRDKEQWKELIKERDLFGIESRDCDFCLKLSLSSHRCSSCLTVQYCSTVCQRKDLEFHKSVCATWAKDKSRRILGKGMQKERWKSVLGEQ